MRQGKGGGIRGRGARPATYAHDFKLDADARSILAAIDDAVAAAGEADRRVTRSQIGFRRRHPFAAVWRPGDYLAGPRPPLVLTVFMRHRDPSPRWKEVVEAAPGRFTHHIEIRDASDIDAEVRDWLEEAWSAAG
jgi:hypothetical protein